MSLKEESQWQAKVVSRFASQHRDKYMAGAVEHKDNGLLQEIPEDVLIDFAIEEVLDLVSYLYTIKLKREEKKERRWINT